MIVLAILLGLVRGVGVLALLTWWVAGAIVPTLLVDPTNFWAWLGVILVLSLITGGSATRVNRGSK